MGSKVVVKIELEADSYATAYKLLGTLDQTSRELGLVPAKATLITLCTSCGQERRVANACTSSFHATF